SPAQDTIIDAGARVLTATFIPNDMARYSSQTITATLQVSKATPVFLISAGPFIYNGSPQPVAVTTTGALGESLAGTTVTCDGAPNAPVHAGSYTVGATLSGNSNYNSATAAGVLVITKAALVAAADDKTRPYGAGNPVLTGTVSG